MKTGACLEGITGAGVLTHRVSHRISLALKSIFENIHKIHILIKEYHSG